IGRLANGGKLRSFPKTLRAAVLIGEKVAVSPFEVEQQPQSLPDTTVGENRTARVEHEAEHVGWRAFFKAVLDDTALFYSREIIKLFPSSRVCFDEDIQQPLLERLKQGCLVSVIFNRQRIEVVETALRRQILAPIVRVALVDNTL